MPLDKKSYSDVSKRASSKQRTAWQRSKTAPNPPAHATRPLAPISESSRNKLSAFQFETSQSELDENTPKQPDVATGDPAKEPHGSLAQDEAQDKVNNATTPGPRFSYQDLLGVQAPTKDDDGVSPSERVVWRHDPGHSFSASMSPMIVRKGRKRARSSSPASSPASKATRAAIDVKRLAQALKTPRTDPAMVLWDRYSVLDGTDTTPSGLPNPLLAQLLASSSPRPSREGNASGGARSLRKTISCGSHWPKRRKVDRVDEHGAVSKRGSPRRSTKSSLVSALLETVDDEIRKSESVEAEARHPRSPSPQKRSSLNGRADAKIQARDSPPRPSSRPSSAGGLLERIPRTAPADIEMTNDDKATVAQIDYSSDYGDDDFDEAFQDLDAILPLIQGMARAPVPAHQNVQDLHEPTVVGNSFGDDTFAEFGRTLPTVKGGNQPLLSVEEPVQGVSRPAIAEDEFEDEFGDDLDDEFLMDAVNLVTQVESKHFSQSAPEGQQQYRLPEPNGEGKADLYDDDFGDDDLGEDLDLLVAAVERQATQSAIPPSTSAPHSTQKPKAIQRYRITNVLDSFYVDGNGTEFPEKILIVQAERTNVTKTIHLRGEWYDTEASPKAFVHVIGHFQAGIRCIIDNKNENMIVLHPDQLISSTVVADSFTCMRRAVLQDRVKATSESTAPLIYGTMLHEIFQEALMANRWDMKFLSAVIDKTLGKHLEDLYVIHISMDDARIHVQSKMAELRSWAEAFVSPQPKPEAIVQGRSGQKFKMCVSKLLDVEEHVWSPMYGLKGNIDATVQVTIEPERVPKKGKTLEDKSAARTLTVPFEVKTGKNVNTNHQAQTTLYNILLSDRYDINIREGILYYMETSATLSIPSLPTEVRQMIMQRNRLAGYIRERSAQLPPMKKDKNMCGRCYAKSSCFIYHKLADDGDGETSGLNKKFDEVVQHLTPAHREFFLKWEDLLTKEEKESQKLRRELWTMLSSEREKLGRCFGNVTIEEGSAVEDKQTEKINRFSYTFIKDDSPAGFSFMDSQLTVGEPIVVSDEQGHFALAIGFVTAVRRKRISVAVDRRLHNARIRQPGFDETNNQVFASIMDVVPEGVKAEDSQGKIKEAPVRYRLDKDEFSSGMATVRNNLIQVMTDELPRSREVRKLVVDLVPPKFKPIATQYAMADKDSLNVDQTAAVEKVMSAADYALVLGMPGTGKTTTIAHIIRALVGKGKTVLLTSYTHSAVDNILLKLKDDGISVLRLGVPGKVHPDVQAFATLANHPLGSFEEIQRAWLESPIVATTCLGIGHRVFNERTFDYCIVDEASQITLPVCLGPIRMALKFVLVGDHNQLPPLVQNEEARAGGLDVSLFKLLSDTHPQAVVNLEHQYRMCEDIMTLSNTLIYEGRLKCGTEALRFASLPIPNMDALRQHHFDAASWLSLSQKQEQSSALSPKKPSSSGIIVSPMKRAAARAPSSFCPSPRPGSCWLRDLLDPEVRVRFVNTDAVPFSREEAKGNRIVNPSEARIVAQLVESLLTVGVPAAEIGVMTHYRSQLALLKHMLRGLGTGTTPVVEMHTADRFQGRDKAVVVLSLVRANDACSIGELLKDWRRINVAFTRAKTKLLVVGSRSTLRGCGDDEMLARFMALMESRDWIYDLGPTALDAHHFMDEMPTQLTPVRSRKLLFGLGEEESPSRKAAAPTLAQAQASRKSEPKKTAKLGERAMKNKGVLRDVLNDLSGGLY